MLSFVSGGSAHSPRPSCAPRKIRLSLYLACTALSAPLHAGVPTVAAVAPRADAALAKAPFQDPTVVAAASEGVVVESEGDVYILEQKVVTTGDDSPALSGRSSGGERPSHQSSSSSSSHVIARGLPRHLSVTSPKPAPTAALATLELIMTNANAAPASGAPVRSSVAQPPVVSAQQMSDLLRRYPDVNDAEKLELVDFLKGGHPDTVAMATVGSGLTSQAAQVKKDYPEHFQSGWRVLLPWLGLFGVVLLLIMLARMV